MTRPENAASTTDCGRSLALLVSDALAFTPEITERRREILVEALRAVARGDVDEADEKAWFQLMLHEDMQTTAAFNPEVYRV